MHLKTREVMRRARRKLTRIIHLETIACGREDGIYMADRARVELEQYLEQEIEALCEKAGLP